MKISILLTFAAGCLFASDAFADGLESKLKRHALSPQEIAEKCKASIQAKVDMVATTDENGRPEKVPRCVLLYRASSQSANSYLTDIQHAVEEVASNAPNCDDNSTQQGCLEAGKKLIEKAADTHAKLAQRAEEIESKFEEFQLPEVGDNEADVEPSNVAARKE